MTIGLIETANMVFSDPMNQQKKKCGPGCTLSDEEKMVEVRV